MLIVIPLILNGWYSLYFWSRQWPIRFRHPRGRGGRGTRPIFGYRWTILQTIQLLSDALTFAWISLNISNRFAYWWSNVHGLESHWNRGQFTYKGTTFGGGKRTNDSKTLSLKETTQTLWAYMFILLKTKTFLYSGTYRLLIAADGSSELS